MRSDMIAYGNILEVISCRLFLDIQSNDQQTCGDSEGGGAGGPKSETPLPPLEIKSGYNLIRNTGTDPHREAIGPLGSNCFSRDVRTELCKIRLTKTHCQDIPTPGRIF